MTRPLALQETINRYRKNRENVYALIDAARDEPLYLISRYTLKLEYQTLFRGELAPVTHHVAPLLFRIPDETEFFDYWAERLGNASGVLLISAESPGNLLRHCQQIFHVKSEDGFEYLYRYFDPRVFRSSILTFNPNQIEDFFGPVSCFFVEDEKPHTLLVCSRDRWNKFISEPLALKPFDPSSKYSPLVT